METKRVLLVDLLPSFLGLFEAYLSLPRVETDLVETIPDNVEQDATEVSQQINLLTL